MRAVFLGTSSFAVPSLEKLISDPQVEVVGVITQPARRAGRGLRLRQPPVQAAAARHGLPILQKARVRGDRDSLDWLRERQLQVAVVVAFGQLLPRSFFEHPPLGTLNLHASLLPAYRGAAPVARALLQGETRTGVTVIRVDEGLDTGGILTQTGLGIREEETAGELEVRLAQLGAGLLVRTLPGYAAGSIPPRPQDDSRASYAPVLRKEEGQIDWSLSAQRIHDQIRALDPWPVAFASFRDQPIRIWKSRLVGADLSRVRAAAVGEVLVCNSSGILVCCGEGSTLNLLELQLTGRRRLPAVDFSNGVGLRAGEMLT